MIVVIVLLKGDEFSTGENYKEGDHSQEPQGKDSRNPQLLLSRHLKRPDHRHWKYQDNEIDQNIDCGPTYVVRIGIDAVPVDSWIPVFAKRNTDHPSGYPVCNKDGDEEGQGAFNQNLESR